MVRYFFDRIYADNIIMHDFMTYLFVVFLLPLCSVSCFCIFRNFRIVNNNRIINVIASTNLGVYLLHDSDIMRELLWTRVLKMDEWFLEELFPIALFLVVLCIYVVCGIADLIQQKIFGKWIDTIWEKIERCFCK